MSEHGGQRLAAAARHGIPPAQWLDLSTGISPWPRLPGAMPAEAWQRLPETGDGLEDAAAGYYGTRALLPAPGTQAIIQTLPQLRPAGGVATTRGSYAEHAAAWTAAGHRVSAVADADLPALADDHDVIVVVNPDNPTGRRLDPATLLALHARLSARGGWLVVDEAFADTDPGASLTPLAGLPGLIVLRSLGKFFGLAGVRLGFAGTDAPLRAALDHRLGPWAVANPARHAGTEALADADWQAEQRARLAASRRRLDGMLHDAGLTPAGGTDLFRYCPHPAPAAVAGALAMDGILVRVFDDPPALRLGLPGTEAQWQHLAAALPAAVRQGAPA